MAARSDFSGQQMIDLNGKPVPGARAFFYQANTATPIVAYQDTALTTPHTYPVVANGLGRFPPMYVDDALLYYRIRIVGPSPYNEVLYDEPQVPAWGPTWWAQPETPIVDPTALLAPGDMIWTPWTSRAGCIRANARTIGNPVSGATERANDDVEAVYLLYWNIGILSVSGGRGASAQADWAAGKQLTLPDMRGRGPFGFDAMGNTAAGRIPGGITPGLTGGNAYIALEADNMPPHDHGGLTTAAGGHSHTYQIYQQTPVEAGFGTEVSSVNLISGGTTGTVPDHTHGIAIDGVGQSFLIMNPYHLGTWFIKI